MQKKIVQELRGGPQELKSLSQIKELKKRQKNAKLAI